MAVFSNYPQSASLSESPITIGVYESGSTIDNSSFQFVLDLFLWKGDSVTDKPTSPNYTFSKFPNQGGGVATFDISSVVNSTMTGSLMDIYDGPPNALEELGLSNNYWYTCDLYTKWVDNNQIVTSSHSNIGNVYLALDGYNLWGERTTSTIGSLYGLTGANAFSESIDNFPILSTLPDVTQSLTRRDLPFMMSGYLRGDAPTGQTSSYVEPYGTPEWWNIKTDSGTYRFSVWDVDRTPELTNSYEVIDNTFLSSSWFDTDTNFEIWISGDASLGYPKLGESIKFKFECEKKYTPARIIFKNRYGAFEQFDFNLVTRKSFSSNLRSYKSNAFNPIINSYDQYRGRETYYSEGAETLTVNTDYIDEKFNEFFKGMLLSDEIYYIPSTKEGNYSGLEIVPLVITSSNLQLKTQEVDKLIQYTFTFDISTPYKLTL